MAEQVYGNVTIKGFVIGPVVVNDYVLGVIKNADNDYALQIKRGGEEQMIPVVSPMLTTEAIEGGTRVTIEDISGTRSFDILNGKDGIDGKDGANGIDGQDGKDGKDGVSPVVAVTEIENGHRVTITDAEGEKTFDVPNGGSGLPEGGAPYQQLVTDGEGKTVWEDRLAYSNELAKATLTLGSNVINVYKVADEIPAFLQDVASGDPIVAWINGTQSTGQIGLVSDAFAVAAEFMVSVARKDKAEVVLPNGMVLGVLPEKGVYFAQTETVTVNGVAPADATAPEIEWDGQTSVVKQIDPKYIPEGVGGSAQTNQLVIHNEYEQPRKANMTYAEIVDALYGGKPLYGAIVESAGSDSSGVTIYPITGIFHMTSEIPYIEIKSFSAFEMQEGSLYMTEDNAFSGMKPGGGGLS